MTVIDKTSFRRGDELFRVAPSPSGAGVVIIIERSGEIPRNEYGLLVPQPDGSYLPEDRLATVATELGLRQAGLRSTRTDEGSITTLSIHFVSNRSGKEVFPRQLKSVSVPASYRPIVSISGVGDSEIYRAEVEFNTSGQPIGLSPLSAAEIFKARGFDSVRTLLSDASGQLNVGITPRSDLPGHFSLSVDGVDDDTFSTLVKNERTGEVNKASLVDPAKMNTLLSRTALTEIASESGQLTTTVQNNDLGVGR